MKRKPKNKQRSFEMNGGYFIDGVAYMDCKITGEPVKNVSTEATSVIGSRAFMARMDKMFPIEDKPKRVSTGRPAGWHFMKEFVDKDGNVFHKGKEQPDLKGTLPPTKIKPKKKAKRRSKEQILLDRHEQKKKVLKKAKKKLNDKIQGQ
tara:strand:+ start:144 stop:590 length:447 start_codon:yes stop_codon:yes gene_type:complete